MKFIFYINGIIYGLTLLGYLSTLLGLYLQLYLGGIQILFFIVLLFNFQKFSKDIQQHLIIYGVLTGIYLVFSFFSISLLNEHWTLFTVPPMLIATYFTYITYKLKQNVL